MADAPRRRSAGFERLGRWSLHRSGLPSRRLRELLLKDAWLRVAGDVIAERAVATAVRRGVLELEIADRRWAGPLSELLPRLAGRLAASFPDLGVRKYRIRVEGGAPGGALTVDPADQRLPRRAESPGTEGTARPESSPSGQRLSPSALADLAERYLRRRDH